MLIDTVECILVLLFLHGGQKMSNDDYRLHNNWGKKAPNTLLGILSLLGFIVLGIYLSSLYFYPAEHVLFSNESVPNGIRYSLLAGLLITVAHISATVFERKGRDKIINIFASISLSFLLIERLWF